jgi:hypothetical protein
MIPTGSCVPSDTQEPWHGACISLEPTALARSWDNIDMAKEIVKTTIGADGLRYQKKASGSPFASVGAFSAASMSCFLCGKHRQRSSLKARKLLGKTQFVCSPSCKEIEAGTSAGSSSTTPGESSEGNATGSE